jgi:hypothetical protein
MKKILLSIFVAAAFAVGSAQAQIAIDNGGNYGSGWTAGSNGGSGFEPWVFNNTDGEGGSAGVFIGDPAAGGISGMSITSFGFFANPAGSGANAEVSRSLSAALGVGETFSFQWGLNWDSDDASSNRGFNLFGGSDQLININMGNSSLITINGDPMFTEFGTQAFTLNFLHQTAGNLLVFGTGRDGVQTFSQLFPVAAAPDRFSFYYNAAENNDNRQMYVNNLEVVPEPSTYALLTLGALALGGYAARRRARK